MKQFLTAFVIFSIWLYFGIWYYECSVKNLCVDTAEVTTNIEVPKVVEPKPVEKKRNYLPFSIVKNSEIVTISDSTSSPLQSYFDYLNINQRKELVITSLFSQDENGVMALSRGQYVKTAFENFGVNPDRIVLQTKREDFDFSETDHFEKGFFYEYLNMSDERIKAIDKGIISKILYAGFGSKTFKPDNTLNAYAIELKNYLVQYPSKHVEIIGHTDSNGETEANVWFGKERAKSVMQYFVSQGIDASKLTISSKGESSPIAPNNTLEGQRLNRRIEINIK